MITLTPNSLLTVLRKNDYQADIQEDSQQVYTLLKVEQKEYPLFLRIFDEGHLLQILAFIPCPLEKASVPDMARLLHLLNKELDMPGFGMDEIAGAVFYRLMLPTPKKKIEEDIIIAFIKTVEQVCKMFATPVEAVGYGQITLDEILNKAKEMESNK